MEEPRSPEIEEIIGSPARWLTLHGPWLLSLLIAALTVLAALYQYPTTVEGELLLTTVDPPRQLKARQGIEVQRLLVSDGQEVEAGQTLLVAKRGGAKWEHVQYLDDQLISVDSANLDQLSALQIPPTLTLGELRLPVFEFQDRQELYRTLSAQRLEKYTTPELRNLIARSELEVRDLQAQESLLQSAFDLAREQLEQENQLADNGVQYTERINAARRRVDRAEEALQSNYSDLRSARFAIEMMRNQIDAYRSGRRGSIEQAALQLTRAYDDLLQAVAKWSRDYTTVSPVTGQVVLSPAVNEDSYVPEGELLATVFPLDAGSTVGRLEVDVRGSGRVARGQRVLIDFPKWPALEYGSVTGAVTEIGLVPVDGKLPVVVTFPDGLVTNKGYTIGAEPYLQGNATIVIDKRPLIRRLLGAS